MVLNYINLYAVNCNEQRRIIGLMKGVGPDCVIGYIMNLVRPDYEYD